MKANLPAMSRPSLARAQCDGVACSGMSAAIIYALAGIRSR